MRQRLIKSCDDRRLGSAVIFRTLVFLGDLDNAFERQNPVKARWRGLDFSGKSLECGQHRGKHRIIDFHR